MGLGEADRAALPAAHWIYSKSQADVSVLSQELNLTLKLDQISTFLSFVIFDRFIFSADLIKHPGKNMI